jgi:hypothetical protein
MIAAPAPTARDSSAQGGGGRGSGRRNPGYGRVQMKPCRGDADSLRRPYRALLQLFSNPGFRPLRVLHPGLCYAALSALGLLIPATINSTVTCHQEFGNQGGIPGLTCSSATVPVLFPVPSYVSIHVMPSEVWRTGRCRISRARVFVSPIPVGQCPLSHVEQGFFSF